MNQVASTAPSSSSLATVAWRYRDGLYVGVAVKAAFRLVPDDRMTPASAPPIDFEGRHYKGSAARSLVYPGDVVPYRPHADVVLRARAHAPTVGLRLEDDLGRALIDKHLTVEMSDEPVDIVGENTAAGDDNPHGARDPAAARIRFADGRDGAATFSPISPFATSRRGLPGADVAGAVGARAKAGTLLELPDDVEWTVFQGAPVDQRIPFLQGHERVVLTGLHPDHPELRCQLPDERGFAFVAAHPADLAPRYERWHPMTLAADTLAIDPEAMTAVMIWRGHLRIDPPELLDALRVIATVAENFDVAELPPPAAVDGATPRSAPPPAPFDASSTRTLGDDDQLAAAAKAALASPFSAGSTKRRARPQMSTMGMRMVPPSRSTLPFAAGGPVEAPSKTEPPAPIPGAPWSPVAAKPVQAPSHDQTTGDVLESDDGPDPFGADASPLEAPPSSDVAPEPPAEEPPAEEPPAEEPPAEEPPSARKVIKAEGWKQSPAPASEPPRRPSAPPPAPRPPPRPAVVDVKSIVYGRFS